MKKNILLLFAISCSALLFSKNNNGAPDKVLVPFVPDICIVTVDDLTKSNIIVWEHSSYPANIKSTNIYRKTAIGADTLLGNVPVTAESEYVDNDPSIDVDLSSYIYRIAAVDSNGNESAKSLPHRTIHLAVSYSASNGAVTMDWNEYSGLAVINANGYDCYRGTKSTAAASIWPFSYSGTGNQVKHDDQISSLVLTDQPFYYVELHTQVACNTAKSYNDSKSNTAVLSVNSVNENSIVRSVSFVLGQSGSPSFVNMNVRNDTPVELSIFDMNGKLVVSEKGQAQSGDNHFLIKTGSLSAGVYQLNIATKSSITVKKIIVN